MTHISFDKRRCGARGPDTTRPAAGPGSGEQDRRRCGGLDG